MDTSDPHQKPVILYEKLLIEYAKQGDKILDTHMGSGSITIACHNLGFDLVACEIDKIYYSAALKRIHNYTAQYNLIPFEKQMVFENNPMLFDEV